MQCKQAQLNVLANPEAPDAATRRHLEQCAACHAFAQMHELVVSERPGVEPPQALDDAVLAAAHTRLAGSGPETGDAVLAAAALEPLRFRRQRALRFPGKARARRLSYAAVLALSGLLFALLFMRTLDQNSTPAGGQAAVQPVQTADWADLDLDLETELLALEAEFVLDTVAQNTDTTVGGNGEGHVPASGEADAMTLEDAMLELELELLFEAERLAASGFPST